MAKYVTDREVDGFLSRTEKWREETRALRAIALDCGLTEELKWGKPCYAFRGKNIVIIQGFKEYCALMFFKGALLHDTEGILVKISENTQAGRQIRFTDVREITKAAAIIKAYILEAVEAEKAGLEVKFKKTADFAVPEEFQTKLNENPALKTAFEALTPGRQHGYLFYFSTPKLSKTRAERVEKYIPKILNGKGLDD